MTRKKMLEEIKSHFGNGDFSNKYLVWLRTKNKKTVQEAWELIKQ